MTTSGLQTCKKDHFKFRLDNDIPQDPLSIVKYSELWNGFKGFTTTMGINPHFNQASGSCKSVLWIGVLVIGLAGLIFNFYSITTTFLQYLVIVKTTYVPMTEQVFPAVTICNTNPIKRSLVATDSRLEALISGWGVDIDTVSRKRRNVEYTRERRSIVNEPGLTECPTNSIFFGEYCYTISSGTATFENARSSCENEGGNLMWFEDEEEYTMVTLMFSDAHPGIVRYWTGMFYDVNATSFAFTWGGSPNYFPWGANQPSGDGDCIENRIRNDEWGLNDMYCTRSTRYICKFKHSKRTDSSSTNYEETACENQATQLACPGGGTVHITSVFYGRNDTITCTENATDLTNNTDCECSADDGCTIRVLEACENQENCWANATDSFLGVDICSDTSKYLNIAFQCWNLVDYLSTTSIPEDETTGYEQLSTTIGSEYTSFIDSEYMSSTRFDTTEVTTLNDQQYMSSTRFDTTEVTTLNDQQISLSTNEATNENAILLTTQHEDTTEGIVTEAVPTSEYEDREPYRDDYLQENDLLSLLADVSIEEKREWGYNISETVANCVYFGQSCNGSHFTEFFDGAFGNCFVFNSGWNSDKLISVSKTGPQHALRLLIKLNQQDYIPLIGESAGAVVVVHPQNRFPFPEDEGVFALPGRINSIGTRKIQIKRLGGNYGDCKFYKNTNKKMNVFEEHYPATRYSRTACFKTCYQKHVIERCHCGDPAYPLTGKAFGNVDVNACRARNITEDDCVYGVTLDYINDRLDCKCHNPCKEEYYKYYLSKSVWPSEAEIPSFLSTYGDDIDMYQNFTDDPEFYKRNFLIVEVFYESLHHRYLEERVKYPYYLFLSDIGSILGLWIGISALTIGEYMELFVDALVLSVAKIIGASRRRKTETEVTQIRVTQACEKDDNYDIIAIKTSILRNSNRRLDLHRPSIRNSGKDIPEKDHIKFLKTNSKNKQKHIHKSTLDIPIE